MSISGGSFSAGYTGSQFLGIAAHTGLRARGFVVQEDTTITVAEDANGDDVMAILGLTGAALKQGAFISIGDGNSLSALTLTAGSIIIYNA